MQGSRQCNPGEVARLIQQLTPIKMNWRELIRLNTILQLEMIIHLAPWRKGWHTGAIFGMDFMDKIDIAVAIDMSGSNR